MAAFLRFRLGFVIGGVGSVTQEGARMGSEGTRRKARGRLHVAIPTLARLGNSRLKARAHQCLSINCIERPLLYLAKTVGLNYIDLN